MQALIYLPDSSALHREVKLNRELEERSTPNADSLRTRARAYFFSNLPIFITSIAIGTIGFFAILTDPKYNSSLGNALGNAFGASLFFGVATFAIGIFIRNISRIVRGRTSNAPSYPNPTPPITRTTPFLTAQGRKPDDQLERSIYLDDLHPWVKSAAEHYWPNGHFRDAVEHAARSVNSETQQKVWSYKDGTDLLNYVFGVDPPKASEGRRLRFKGDPRSDTWKNRMQAGQALGRACYLGVRNIAAHEKELDWSRQLAFQYLVMFSVLAQWIDECDVTGVS